MPQPIERVSHFVKDTPVIELQFERDASIPTYPPRAEGLVTKGQAPHESSPCMQPCKAEEDEEIDPPTTGTGSASMPSSGSSSREDQYCSNDTVVKCKSGRSRAREAKRRASIQRLHSPGDEFYR